jgi:hypothetical protein
MMLSSLTDIHLGKGWLMCQPLMGLLRRSINYANVRETDRHALLGAWSCHLATSQLRTNHTEQQSLISKTGMIP